MAAVSINTGPVDYRDQMKQLERSKWRELFIKRQQYIHTEFEHGCECVIDWLAEAEEFYEELGYSSADEMLEEALEIPPDWVRMAAAVLEATGENLSKAEIDHAIELKAHGRPRRDQEGKGVNHTFPDSARGTGNAEYIKARLRRDHPEIAEALERGEFKSARAAAIDAGIIKPVPTIRLTDDINKVAQAISRYLNDQQRIALAEALLPTVES